jgi:hypothetical protein
MASTDINVRELTHQITLRVRGLRGFGVRLWIAAKLFKLGAWIAGVGIIIEQGGDDGSS